MVGIGLIVVSGEKIDLKYRYFDLEIVECWKNDVVIVE